MPNSHCAKELNAMDKEKKRGHHVGVPQAHNDLQLLLEVSKNKGFENFVGNFWEMVRFMDIVR